MKLTNEFILAVPLDEAWMALTKIEVVAPCMPGAELREVEGDEYRGLVKVKVGAITASYRGVAKFLKLDQVGRRAVLKVEGRETHGQGSARATIAATLVSEGGGTRVEVNTDLAITGRVAQFARGVLAEVLAKLLDQFVRNLETAILVPAAAPSANDREWRDQDRDREVRADMTEMQSSTAGDPTEGDTPDARGGETTALPAARKRATASAPANLAVGPIGVGDQATTAVPAASGLRQIEPAPARPVDLLDVVARRS